MKLRHFNQGNPLPQFHARLLFDIKARVTKPEELVCLAKC